MLHNRPARYVQESRSPKPPLQLPNHAFLYEFPILRIPQAPPFTSQKRQGKHPERVLFTIEGQVVFVGLIMPSGVIDEGLQPASFLLVSPVGKSISEIKSVETEPGHRLGGDGSYII